jgi:Na+/glutamate symporter
MLLVMWYFICTFLAWSIFPGNWPVFVRLIGFTGFSLVAVCYPYEKPYNSKK